MNKYKINYSNGGAQSAPHPEDAAAQELYDLNKLYDYDSVEELRTINLDLIKRSLRERIMQSNFDRVGYDKYILTNNVNSELKSLIDTFNLKLQVFNSQKGLIDNNFSFIEKFLKKNNINIDVNYMNIPLILNELNNKLKYIKVNCDGNNDFYQILENDLNETYINQILERLVNIVKLFGIEILQVMNVEIIDVTVFGLLDKMGKIKYLKTTCSKVSSYINDIVTSLRYYDEILNILYI